MIEVFFIVIGIFFFSSIFLGAAYHILKFIMPPILRFLIFVTFDLSVIRPDVRKSFDGTYIVTYLKWNDEDGTMYCTEDKWVNVKKMHYAFKGDNVYSDFDVEWNDHVKWFLSKVGKVLNDADCRTEVKGLFTVHGYGSVGCPDGRKLDFEIRMMKISNKVIRKFFRCVDVNADQ